MTYAAIIRAVQISTGASTVVEYDELTHPETTLVDSADSEPHMTHTTSAEVSRTTESPTASVSSIDTEHSSGIGNVLPKLTHAKTSVKLPKLTLRSFSGDLTQWFTFWDSFIAAVHNNSQLVDVDKFNYLKSLLSGVALEAVQGLALTDANYKEAVTILQRRFGNRQQIIDKHMDQLLKADSITSPRNVVGLRRHFDSIESHIRSFNSLGVKVESYSSLLSSVLLNKLPEEIQLLISRKVPEKDWGLTSLLEVFEEELQARERVTSEVTRSARNGRQTSISTGATLFSGVYRGNGCCYCEQSHSPKDCGVVTQVEARR